MNKKKFVVKIAMIIIGSNAILPIIGLSHNKYGELPRGDSSLVARAEQLKDDEIHY
ncbi:hypothetical protein SAMN02745116_00327 [Pilibacter termitis]|uniref:Uncharacterized protein n=1 Tax=Pilibacter termitis TaxID=263852 RepID=A0A1T4KQA1_9ENTE|nr:hypothetical protein [Pilibacter termitis]SJZ44528.1 hypothetical protein SAMN02745116_00327 [Pilibacter termitis]